MMALTARIVAVYLFLSFFVIDPCHAAWYSAWQGKWFGSGTSNGVKISNSSPTSSKPVSSSFPNQFSSGSAQPTYPGYKYSQGNSGKPGYQTFSPTYGATGSSAGMGSGKANTYGFSVPSVSSDPLTKTSKSSLPVSYTPTQLNSVFGSTNVNNMKVKYGDEMANNLLGSTITLSGGVEPAGKSWQAMTGFFGDKVMSDNLMMGSKDFADQMGKVSSMGPDTFTQTATGLTQGTHGQSIMEGAKADPGVFIDFADIVARGDVPASEVNKRIGQLDKDLGAGFSSGVIFGEYDMANKFSAHIASDGYCSEWFKFAGDLSERGLPSEDTVDNFLKTAVGMRSPTAYDDFKKLVDEKGYESVIGSTDELKDFYGNDQFSNMIKNNLGAVPSILENSIATGGIEEYSKMVKDSLDDAGISDEKVKAAVKDMGVLALGRMKPADFALLTANRLDKDDDRPVGVVVYTSADNNGVSTAGAKDMISQLASMDNYRILYYEAGSEGELADALNDATSDGQDKAAFVQIVAHGTPQSSMIGPDEKSDDNNLDLSDMALNSDNNSYSLEPWLDALKNSVDDNGSIILLSCQTAKGEQTDMNVAKMISLAVPQAAVYAPEVSTSGLNFKFLDRKIVGATFYESGKTYSGTAGSLEQPGIKWSNQSWEDVAAKLDPDNGKRDLMDSKSFNTGFWQGLSLQSSALGTEVNIKNIIENTDEMAISDMENMLLGGQYVDNAASEGLEMLSYLDDGASTLKFLDDKDISIVFADVKKEKGDTVGGLWSGEYNTIVLDKTLEGDSGSIAATIVHEMTHAKQEYEVHPEGFPSEGLKATVDYEYEAYKAESKIQEILNPDSKLVSMFSQMQESEIKDIIRKSREDLGINI